MPDPASNDELDWLIWLSLRDSNLHPFSDPNLTPPGGDWGGSKAARIDCRLQAMRHDGRIRFHRHGPGRPAHVRNHGWEVLGCPGAGVQEDGQWHWREGCDDCTRRTRPDPADRFRLGEVWRSPRQKDWTVDKIDSGLARLRSVTKPKNTQWRGVHDTGRDMTIAWFRVSLPGTERPQLAAPKGNLP
jgi:hypothetical protein